MSVDEHSPQESSQETDQPAVRVVSGYCATRRTARKHKRVIRQGTELFDADGVKLDRPMCSPNVSAMRMTTSVFWVNCRRIGACSPRGDADIRLGFASLSSRTDDGDNRTVLLSLQNGRCFMRRHGKHCKGVAVRIARGFRGQDRARA